MVTSHPDVLVPPPPMLAAQLHPEQARHRKDLCREKNAPSAANSLLSTLFQNHAMQILRFLPRLLQRQVAAGPEHVLLSRDQLLIKYLHALYLTIC